MNRIDLEIARDMGRFYDDPLGFVLYSFAWGEGELAGFDGPDVWQREQLEYIGHQVKDRGFNGVDPVEPIRDVTSSGHGIGKSFETAMIILWIMSTRPHCKGIVTANSAPQLQTKTWAELAKWKKRCITGHWFDLSSGKGSMKISHKDHSETWRCDAQTCREENSESFAGLHAANSTPFYIFDEASAVPNIIWEVAEGGLTDGEPMFFAFGNPTRNTGKFRECFGRQSHRWNTRQIDSRDAKMTNKKLIESWIADEGEDSDFIRVRVRGVFPRVSSMQFISADVVDEALRREVMREEAMLYPLFFGVDVARFGDDASVIVKRRGNKMMEPPLVYRGLDTVEFTTEIVDQFNKDRPDLIYIDADGLGAGIYDKLKSDKLPVVEVRSGLTSSNPKEYANTRAEMWGEMKSWLKGADLPNHQKLKTDLTHIEYGYNAKNQIALERKESMKGRGEESPDCGDPLAYTFYPFANRVSKPNRRQTPQSSAQGWT